MLVPVYWLHHGPANFLWACDIALLVTVAALWRASRLLASMMAVAVLLQPGPGGSVSLMLTPMQLLDRLAALIPPRCVREFAGRGRIGSNVSA